MTTTTSKTSSTAAAPATTPAATTASADIADGDGQPKKKKKKKYSRQLKAVQQGEEGLTKGAERLARAIEEGLGVWRKRRDKSSRSRRDGSIRDVVQNIGKAASEFTRIASKIPEDITDALPKVRR